jgi:hypothetical protein
MANLVSETEDSPRVLRKTFWRLPRHLLRQCRELLPNYSPPNANVIIRRGGRALNARNASATGQ